jgi:16S rRNA processing protein RimM|tara:strand:- start:1537 stop:2034 length:498 start_codon:yes stop_codon:yes gene_type:complete
MKKPDLQYLGEFIKLFSFKGELIFYSELKSVFVENLDSLFVNFNESYVPFQIIKVKSHKKNNYRTQLQNVNSESEAKRLLKKDIYIERIENSDNSDYLVDNFKVYNNNKYIGVVISTINKTEQSIMEVKMSNKVVLIPLVDQFIVEINDEELKIDMDLPEGLLDI